MSGMSAPDAAPAQMPNPGSDAAVERGCTCPRRDNQYGEGAWEFEGEMHWWRAEHCPLHGFRLAQSGGAGEGAER